MCPCMQVHVITLRNSVTTCRGTHVATCHEHVGSIRKLKRSMEIEFSWRACGRVAGTLVLVRKTRGALQARKQGPSRGAQRHWSMQKARERLAILCASQGKPDFSRKRKAMSNPVSVSVQCSASLLRCRHLSMISDVNGKATIRHNHRWLALPCYECCKQKCTFVGVEVTCQLIKHRRIMAICLINIEAPPPPPTHTQVRGPHPFSRRTPTRFGA